MMMADNQVNDALLKQAFRYLLEQGEPIKLTCQAEVPAFEMEGQPISASQVVLKAYAAGMADVV